MPEYTPAPTPARSLYGFFMYLFFKTLFFIYCVWAFVPDKYLYYINIEYYPLKYWATAIPIQCLVALTLFVFIIFPSANLMLAPNVNDLRTIRDQHTQDQPPQKTNIVQPTKCICKDRNKCFMQYYEIPPHDADVNRVDALHDLNISYVCKKLYLNKKI